MGMGIRSFVSTNPDTSEWAFIFCLPPELGAGETETFGRGIMIVIGVISPTFKSSHAEAMSSPTHYIV